MPSLKQSSKVPSTLALLASVIALLAVIALPASAAAAPSGPPELSFEPGDYDFGLQPVYSTSRATLQLRNEGAEQIWVESVNVVGSGAGTFWIGNSDCWSGPVEPGAACSLEVSFGPNEPVDYEAQVRVTVAGTDFYADLSGEGASPYFVPDASPVDFGIAKVGGDGTTREVTVTNEGNWPGGVFIAVVSGGAVASYQLLDENCTNRALFPADTCTVQVRFRPIAEGVKKATLSLFGESDGGTQVALTGAGAAPDPVPASNPPAAASVAADPGAVTVVVRHVKRDRTAIRERKRQHRLQRRQRIQRLRTLRRRRALLRHRRLARANIRGRVAIGG
ncbi:MAG TPA: choice-of-anchor D domain-containing protein [Solirubrobacterales bacterium]|nr:choice-of-anchor D domain-containing protein [Solirubrobacterales bacterium]